MNLVAPKDGAKNELLFYKPASVEEMAQQHQCKNMTIVMSDACAITVSRSKIVDSRSINYKHTMIIRKMPQFVAPLTDNSRSVTKNCNMCIIQAIYFGLSQF